MTLMPALSLAPRTLLPAAVPAIERCSGPYLIRLARTADEVEAALRMRFEVFNLELGEGLPSSHATGCDRDPFDEHCHHLLVIHQPTGAIAGTYRLQGAERARAGRGFYSAGEFDLTGLPPRLVAQSVEVGRACVAAPHRTSGVILRLWEGIAAYLKATGKGALFGCCSLTGQDCEAGARVWRWLRSNGHLHGELAVTPRPACGFPVDPCGAPAAPSEVPPLLAAYLRLGAKVLGPPALDRSFGTIDFFVLLELAAVPPAVRRRFAS